MVKRCVFLAISYTEEMKVENAIKKYLQSWDLEVICGRDVASGGNLRDEILNLIQECDFGVVVYNELRHNISYELGLLDAFKKTAAILIDKSGHAHVDFDKDLSDMKGTAHTSFYGEGTEEKIIEQLTKNNGLVRALYRCRGIAHGKNTEFRKTIEDLKKAIELTPNDFTLYNDRGEAYAHVKDFDNAIKDFRRAIELNPEYATAYINLAALYIKRNYYGDALITAQKSLGISKDIDDIILSKFLIVLSLILQGKGDKEEKELIEYSNLNKGCKITFEFDRLKDALKDSEYSPKINKLIKVIKANAKSNS